MKILSLFDGIACGRIALERAGIPVDEYYASEIDKYAINVAQKNYPDIIELGDINNWRTWDIEWQQIDLVIGGSPCQGFSNAGKGLNFDDTRSKLFFIFVDIVNHIKEVNPNVKFLLENVKMKQEWVDTISEYMMVQPLLINSNLVSAQNRPRYYWTNINNINLPNNKDIKMKDIIDQDNFNLVYNEFIEFTNFYTVPRAKDGLLVNGSYNRIWKIDSYCGALSVCNIPKIGFKMFNNIYSRKITINEAEKLQTLPIGYTSSIKESERFKCIGNGWTVDIIAHIFSFLKEDKNETNSVCN